jgi:hypothetical protein
MDITAQMQRFRHASRDVWNHYFLATASGARGGAVDCAFDEVEDALYRGLVLRPAARPDAHYGFLTPRIHVRVAGEFGAPAMVNRGTDSGSWDHPVQRLDRDADLGFVSFFDWDENTLRDLQYVRVQILAHPNAELVGKHALIEVQYVTFEVA